MIQSSHTQQLAKHTCSQASTDPIAALHAIHLARRIALEVCTLVREEVEIAILVNLL